MAALVGIVLACIVFRSGFSATDSRSGVAVFCYDRAAFPGMKPWTSEQYRNNPDESKFAVIGDRTGASDTIIAGHLHYYDIEQRNGRDYVTGGQRAHRGTRAVRAMSVTSSG